MSNISVLVEKVGKSKIEDFGSPEAYLEKILRRQDSDFDPPIDLCSGRRMGFVF